LDDKRGVRNCQNLAALTEEKVLEWADTHHLKTSLWPRANSGSIEGAGGETWAGVDSALFKGRRGFSGGSSLAKFLAEKRGVRNEKELPLLSEQQILNWADSYFAEGGELPKRESGPIAGTNGETWNAVDSALKTGRRGLSGGSSLAQLIKERLVES